MSRSVIQMSPDILGGTPVFQGTRVPIQTLLDYLEAGDSIKEFLVGYPTVSKDQAIDFLKEAKEKLLDTIDNVQPGQVSHVP